MKVLEKNESNKNWNLIIYCRDSGWNDKASACGSKLQVFKNDIRYRYLLSENGNSRYKIYGTVCPICGTFIQIDSDRIPLVVKHYATNIIEKE